MNESTFIQMIREHPDEDGPRLVFADWLEEQGDADRAEFIRVQIELSHLPQDDPRRAELEERERVLLREHVESWISPFQKRISAPVFRRGLLEGVRMSGEMFLRFGKELVRRSPVSDLNLFQLGAAGIRLAELPEMELIRDLDMSRLRSTHLLANFLASQRLHNLQSLDLSGNWNFVPSSIAFIFNLANLPRLRNLNLSNNRLHDYWFHGVASRLRSLESLDLSQNIFHDSTDSLASAPLLEGLRTLDLSGNADGEPIPIEALVASPHLTHLVELRLNRNLIDDDRAVAIANASNLANLERLELTGNAIGARGALALVHAHHLNGLRHLDLRKNHFGRIETRLLQRRFGKRVLLSI